MKNADGRRVTHRDAQFVIGDQYTRGEIGENQLELRAGLLGLLTSTFHIFSGFGDLRDHGVKGFGERIDFTVARKLFNGSQIALGNLASAAGQLQYRRRCGTGKHKGDGHRNQDGEQHGKRERDRIHVTQGGARQHQLLIVSVTVEQINGVTGHSFGHNLRELQVGCGLQGGIGVHRHNTADAQGSFAFGLFSLEKINAVFGARFLQLRGSWPINHSRDGGRERT